MQILRIKHSNYQTKNDNELIALFKKNCDNNIIGIFYERYNHIVYGICLKYFKNPDNAKDATLDIYSSLYELIAKYEISEFKHWLLTVTRNHCIKQLKKESRHAIITQNTQIRDDSIMENEAENTPQDKEEQLSALEKAINELKPEQKQCIELFFLQEKSYNEIADITKHDIKKVKSYIQNGKRNLQIFLSKELAKKQ